MGLSIFTYNHHHYVSTFRTFSSPQKETLYKLAITPHCSLPQALANTNILPVSMDLPNLNILYK